MTQVVSTPDRTSESGLPQYFDMQAAIGHTKHVGGWRSTQEIAGMCSLKPADHLLYVGSGSGLAAIRLAQTYGCRITGVDIMPTMVEAARKWAALKGVAGLVEFRVGDAMELPFDDAQFDVLLCESVNTFIPDLDRAIGEYLRVIKPGGRVALNEAVWYRQPSEKAERLMFELTGQRLREEGQWIEALERNGLQDIQARTYPVDMKVEMGSQFGFLSFSDAVRIIWRTIGRLFTDPHTRSLMKLATNDPKEAYSAMGYGLYVGRVPG